MNATAESSGVLPFRAAKAGLIPGPYHVTPRQPGSTYFLNGSKIECSLSATWRMGSRKGPYLFNVDWSFAAIAAFTSLAVVGVIISSRPTKTRTTCSGGGLIVSDFEAGYGRSNRYPVASPLTKFEVPSRRMAGRCLLNAEDLVRVHLREAELLFNGTMADCLSA